MKALKLTPQEKNLYVAWKNRIQDFMNAYNQKDVAKMLQNCTPQCQVAFLPLGGTGKGNVHEVGKNIWTLLFDCFPSIHNTISTMDLEDGRVKCEVNITGRQERDFGELKSKGNRFEEDHIFIFKVNDNNQITDIQINWDHDHFVKQLTA